MWVSLESNPTGLKVWQPFLPQCDFDFGKSRPFTRIGGGKEGTVLDPTVAAFHVLEFASVGRLPGGPRQFDLLGGGADLEMQLCAVRLLPFPFKAAWAFGGGNLYGCGEVFLLQFARVEI